MASLYKPSGQDTTADADSVCYKFYGTSVKSSEPLYTCRQNITVDSGIVSGSTVRIDVEDKTDETYLAILATAHSLRNDHTPFFKRTTETRIDRLVNRLIKDHHAKATSDYSHNQAQDAASE